MPILIGSHLFPQKSNSPFSQMKRFSNTPENLIFDCLPLSNYQSVFSGANSLLKVGECTGRFVKFSGQHAEIYNWPFYLIVIWYQGQFLNFRQ